MIKKYDIFLDYHSESHLRFNFQLLVAACRSGPNKVEENVDERAVLSVVVVVMSSIVLYVESCFAHVSKEHSLLQRELSVRCVCVS